MPEPLAVHCVDVASWDRAQLRAAFRVDRSLHPVLSARPLAHELPRLRDARVLSLFVHSSLDAATLAELPALEFVATRSTGYDHIDLDACRKRGVTVCTVPTYGENTVAEHTFALILGLSRKLPAAERHGARHSFDWAALQGFDLVGKTLGVVGAGRIGAHVIRIARAFGMAVVAYDPFQNDLMADVLGFSYVEFDELLARAHVVSLHAPGGDRHVIDEAALARMRPGALLINTARGSLVDSPALLAALRSGHLGGAGLDVFEGETDLDDEYVLATRPDAAEGAAHALTYRLLADLPNVILTPHNAFNSVEAVARIASTTVDNIRAWRAGSAQNVAG